VLLLRFLQEGESRVARKVATATMSAAKFQATMGRFFYILAQLFLPFLTSFQYFLFLLHCTFYE
jgi:hypothetical protein